MRTAVPFAALLLTSFAGLSAQKVELRYDFKPGTVSWSEMTQEMIQNMQMGERNSKTSLVTTMWLEGKVTDVKDGVASIEQRYARVKVKSDNPMMKVDYDSDVEGSSPGAMRNLADLIDKTAKSKVDRSGKVIEFNMPEGLGDAVAATGASLKQGFEQQFAMLPKDPVGVGDTWQSTLEFPMDRMGSMKASITNKLVALEAGVATIELTMVMDTSGVKFPGGMTMEVPKASGKQKIAFTGIQPVEATMDMEMKVVGPKDTPMNMSMGMHMTVKQIPAPAAKKPAAAPTTGGK